MGGWVDRGKEGGSNGLLYAMGGWVGGWVGGWIEAISFFACSKSWAAIIAPRV